MLLFLSVSLSLSQEVRSEADQRIVLFTQSILEIGRPIYKLVVLYVLHDILHYHHMLIRGFGDLEQHGYSHLFVILLSGLMALMFQILATRLGCVSDEGVSLQLSYSAQMR